MCIRDSDNGKEIEENGYITDILTNKAIDWLTNKRDQSKPFILNLWHKAVHEKHLPAPRHKELFKGLPLPEPPHNTHKETFEGKPAWQRRKTFGFKWDKSSNTYELVTDLDLWKFELPVERFISKVTQMYAYQTIISKTREDGYQIVEQNNKNDGSIELVVTKWDN